MEPWSKADERGLARYVTPELVRYLPLAVNRTDQLTQPDGPRQVVAAIYANHQSPIAS